MTDLVELVQYGDGARYDLGAGHPLKPARVLLTYRLIADYGILDSPGVGSVDARDATDTEIGRIDKKFVGVARAVFTTGDKYIVDISPSVSGDLRLMALAASLAVDTALKQDARGFSVTDLLDS